MNALLLQSTAQYSLPRRYYVPIGGFTWSFDGKNGGKPTIRLTLQGGA